MKKNSLLNNENIENNFELTQTATIQIPILEEGEYVLVAYVMTANEGIRVSNPISVQGTIEESTKTGEGVINFLSNGQDNKIHIIATKTADINVHLDGSYSYEEIYLILESYAYKYGRTIDSYLEKYVDSNWEHVENNTTISNGIYRLGYFNNSFESEAYIVAVID